MYKFLKNKYFWLVLIVVAIILGTIELSSSERVQISVIEKNIRDAYTPLQSGVSGFKDNFKDFTVYFSNKKNLLREIKALKQENQQLAFENQVLREYKAEALRLERVQNFERANLETFDFLSARVIARNHSNWYKAVVIDKGLKDGVSRNMPVISPEGLVGRVSSISENSAMVTLITDREMAVGVILQESRETRGIVEGLGDSNMLRMVNIPYYSTIREGEKVVSSGLSEIYPKGIDIGTVVKVNNEPGGLLLSASIKPAVNFDKLEEVLLIKGYHPEKYALTTGD